LSTDTELLIGRKAAAVKGIAVAVLDEADAAG